MSDPIEALLDAVERDTGGVAVVWAPQDIGVRDWLVSQLESLVPERKPVRVGSVDEALAEPHRLALLVPVDERETVLDLDGSRDRCDAEDDPRTQPIVLFLFRDGAGQEALAHAISLSGWVRGSTPDPEAMAEVDEPAERARFESRTGETPESWLRGWRQGTTVRTAENCATAFQALLLERR